ncbi:MAG: TadE/TadG family type IV pilus assembly protein [Thiobacillus sp.]
MRRGGPRPQQGAAIVEFAIVAMLFFTLLVGIVEMGRVLFTWNSAAEATRRGVRMAVVTDPGNAAAIRDEMRIIMPDLADNQISITYLPAGCTVASCDYVTVGVGEPVAYTVTPLVVPIGPLTLPPFSTTLPRESLGAG